MTCRTASRTRLVTNPRDCARCSRFGISSCRQTFPTSHPTTGSEEVSREVDAGHVDAREVGMTTSASGTFTRERCTTDAALLVHDTVRGSTNEAPVAAGSGVTECRRRRDDRSGVERSGPRRRRCTWGFPALRGLDGRRPESFRDETHRCTRPEHRKGNGETASLAHSLFAPRLQILDPLHRRLRGRSGYLRSE